MTIVIGIEAVDGIVLASDGRFVLDEDKERGITRTQEGQKIIIGPNYALAVAGDHDKYLEAFFGYLNGKRTLDDFIDFVSEGSSRDTKLDQIFISGVPLDHLAERASQVRDGKAEDLTPIESAFREYIEKGRTPDNLTDQAAMAWFMQHAERRDPIEYAVRTGFLRELGILNRFAYLRQRGRYDEEMTLNETILAVNKPGLGLFSLDIFGNLHQTKTKEYIQYVGIGRGASLAKEYFEREEYVDDPLVGPTRELDRVTLLYAIKLAQGALERAYTEVNSGGYPDLVVVQRDRIMRHGQIFKNRLGQANRDSWGEILSLYEAGNQTKLPL